MFSSIRVCTQEANAKELSRVKTEKSHLEGTIRMLEKAMYTDLNVEKEVESKELKTGLPAEVRTQIECIGV